MKRVLAGVTLVVILLVGSVSVFADPIAVPTENTTCNVVIPLK